ncbi:uncharacterized protein snapc2 isoform 2-T2 [Spinachia spinachia]
MATERVEEPPESPADTLRKVFRERRHRLRLPEETRPHPVHYRAPDSGGLFEGQRALIGELQAKQEEVGRGECQKTHRHVDTNGFHCCWKPRASHYRGFLSEPCTLRNCDPPHILVRDGLGGCTLPISPMPQMPNKVERPGTSGTRPVLLPKTPGPAIGPGRRLSASAASTPTPQSPSTPSRSGVAVKILVVPAPSPQPASRTSTPISGTPGSGSARPVKTQNIGLSLIQAPQLPCPQTPTTISASSPSEPPSSSPHTPIPSSATSQAPVPSMAALSSATTEPLLSTPAAACCGRFGCTGDPRKCNLRVSGVMGVVDFEKIYHYLSCIHQPSNKCDLTPMESAIMLDLLMSLPEELPLLDCNKLHKHLIQMYQFLSSTADSKMAQQMFEELKEGLCAGGDEQANSQPSPAQAGVEKNMQPNEAESQSSGSTDALGQSEDLVLCPALNPFMVPLKLLMRK